MKCQLQVGNIRLHSAPGFFIASKITDVIAMAEQKLMAMVADGFQLLVTILAIMAMVADGCQMLVTLPLHWLLWTWLQMVASC